VRQTPLSFLQLLKSLLAAAQKGSEAYEGNGMLEYWNIEVVGFERINPSFHPSTLPISRTLE
ncbi:MAG TPA: hypothetical protein VGA01_00620, partial [Candidatus Binatia bacterium]